MTLLDYKNDTEADERLNPANALNEAEQSNSDKEFSELTNPEHQSKDGTPGDLSGGAVKSAEENPGIINKFTGAKNKVTGKINIFKRKGPLAAIITLVFGGGIGFSALFSPGILLVQMKEELVNRFNTQLTSMDMRTTKVMQAKFDSTTSGLCAGKLTIKCKYSTMSDKQVAKFKAAGIEVKSNGTNLLGRTKPDVYIFKDETISSKDFSTKLHADRDFNAAVKKAYNPKFAGFTDNIWGKISTKLGINKQKSLPEGDAAAKEKSITDKTKNGTKIAPISDGLNCPSSGGDCTDSKGNKVTSEEAKKIKAAAAETNKVIEEAAQSADNVAVDVLAETSSKLGSLTSSATYAVSITGYLDNACQMYNSVRALGYAAKTVRAVQLARYAMVFVNTADQIKAGTATPGDVAYLGGILTNVAYDAKAGANRKAAMDSFGMKYTMFGEVGKSDSYVSQFMAGGGLTGDLIAITSYINNTISGGNVAATCKTLSNGWVQAASTLGGIALLFVPGVNIAITGKVILQAGGAIFAQVAMMALPGLLKDIVAGNVIKNISPEGAGNAITSGFGTMTSQLSQGGGNGPMTVDDAIAYNQTQNEVLASYAQNDRDTLSPFDPTNQNTFLGSIVNRLLPYSSQVSSLSGTMSSLASIVSGSFASIIPKSQALTNAQYKTAYTSCTDEDYKAMNGGRGIATDPFCNVIYGITPKYLDKDPLVVIDELAGQLDDSDNPIGEYKTFVDDCIDRKEPLGSTGDSGTDDPGNKCILNDKNANYYLHYVDQRVNNGMGNEESTANNIISAAPTGSAIDGDDYSKECSNYLHKGNYCPGNMYGKECTAFILFRLVKHGVIKDQGISGTGGQYTKNLGNIGFKVDNTPAVHAVMSTYATSHPTLGHTAIVSEVRADGSFVVEEYNFANPYAYSTRLIPASAMADKSMTFAHTETKYQ